jgi:hypothetical protein
VGFPVVNVTGQASVPDEAKRSEVIDLSSRRPVLRPGRDHAPESSREHAARVAHQIRSELAGSSAAALDIESEWLGAFLETLRCPDHEPPVGWESEVVASVARLNTITARIADLARSHVRATSSAD